MRFWVVGGTSGIGLGMVERLLQKGETPLVLSNDPDGSTTIESRGGVFRFLDLGDAGVAEHTAAAVAEYGSPGVVLMSAGYTLEKRGIETGAAEWQRLAAVNLLGVVQLCHAVAQTWMTEKPAGWTRQFVLIGSVNAWRPLSSQGAYSVMKAGLHAYAKCLANDVADHQIRVNVVVPGAILTPMSTRLLVDDAAGDKERAIVNSALLRRWGKPEEVADVALWLATESPPFVNGCEIVVDGGHTVMR